MRFQSCAIAQLLGSIVLIVVGILALASSVLAFTEPASAPLAGDVSAPINVGSTTQYRSGWLGVGTAGNPVHPLDVYGSANGYSVVAGNNIGSLGDICTLNADGTNKLKTSQGRDDTHYHTPIIPTMRIAGRLRNIVPQAS